MPAKIALKRLTKSDLTIFECHFRNPANSSKQKSLNLNSDVFVDQLYPHASGRVPQDGAPLPAVLYGPGGGKGIAIKSTITPRNDDDPQKQKNWRLGGPLIHDPSDEPTRFHVLQPGDLVVMSFDGDPVPTNANLVFVAHDHPDDVLLHSALDEFIPGKRRTMVQLSPLDLQTAASTATLPASHPFLSALLEGGDADIEDASFGSATGVKRATRGGRRTVSAEELERARSNAQRIGRDGEELVNAYLEKQLTAGSIADFKWVADENAAAPLDFYVTSSDGSTTSIDAKSTTGPFVRAFHISAAEIAEAATSKEPYLIYRVYEITQEGSKLKISDDIRTVATELQDALGKLPRGFQPDSFRVDPTTMTWSDEILLERTEE